MGAISFNLLMILGFLAIPAEPRTFPGDQTAVVIIYERSSSSRSLPLDLSTIIAAINPGEENTINDVVRNGSSGDKGEAPFPITKAEFRFSGQGCDSANNSTDDCISMVTEGAAATRKPTPPPAPKPAAPTHPTL